jgi:hypothetical protein
LLGGTDNIPCVQPTNAICVAALGFESTKQWDSRMLAIVLASCYSCGMQRTNIKHEAPMALSSIFEFLHSPSKCVSVAADANLPHVLEILLTNTPSVSKYKMF